jgi:hypothetical protein
VYSIKANKRFKRICLLNFYGRRMCQARNRNKGGSNQRALAFGQDINWRIISKTAHRVRLYFLFFQTLSNYLKMRSHCTTKLFWLCRYLGATRNLFFSILIGYAEVLSFTWQKVISSNEASTSCPSRLRCQGSGSCLTIIPSHVTNIPAVSIFTSLPW